VNKTGTTWRGTGIVSEVRTEGCLTIESTVIIREGDKKSKVKRKGGGATHIAECAKKKEAGWGERQMVGKNNG